MMMANHRQEPLVLIVMVLLDANEPVTGLGSMLPVG
jgi:hypothetical protein